MFNKNKISKSNGKTQADDEIDWDAMNSDELDSEDLDNLEKFGKLPNKEGQKHTKNDIKVSTGFSEDIGKKLIKKKHEHSTEKTGKLTEFQKW